MRTEIARLDNASSKYLVTGDVDILRVLRYSLSNRLVTQHVHLSEDSAFQVLRSCTTPRKNTIHIVVSKNVRPKKHTTNDWCQRQLPFPLRITNNKFTWIYPVLMSTATSTAGFCSNLVQFSNTGSQPRWPSSIHLSVRRLPCASWWVFHRKKGLYY